MLRRHRRWQLQQWLRLHRFSRLTFNGILPPLESLCHLESESVSRLVVSDSLWPYGLYYTRLLCPWSAPGKNPGVGSQSFLQRIFLTQGSNPGILGCRQILYCLSHQGSPFSPYFNANISPCENLGEMQGNLDVHFKRKQRKYFSCQKKRHKKSFDKLFKSFDKQVMTLFPWPVELSFLLYQMVG